MSDLVTALAAAQAKFQPIVKSHKADAGKYTYTYANLADTLAAVVPALNAQGIVLLQPIQYTADGVELQTVLLGHGERLSASLPLVLEGLPAQDAGKLISYMRRYLVTSFLGLAADDDDAAANVPVKYRSDGSRADQRPVQRATPAEMDARPVRAPGGPPRPATDKQKQFAQAAYVAFLGLAADDDDAAANVPVKYRSDGSRADQRPVQRATPAEMDARPVRAPGGPPRPATDKQKQFAQKMLNGLGLSPAEASAVLELLAGVDGVDLLTAASASSLIDELNAVKKREKAIAWDDEGNPRIDTVVALVEEGTEPW